MANGDEKPINAVYGRICGIDIVALSPTAAAQALVDAAVERKSLEAHLCNAFTLSLVDSDAELRAALLRADLNLPDGTPVAWLLRPRGARGPVRGPSLVTQVARSGAAVGLRHYFWGGQPGVAEAVAQRLETTVRGLQVAGFASPPFGNPSDNDLAELAARVRATGAHIVWVGLGTPRQDYVVPRLAPLVDCPVVPVGAAFDFLAGTVAEAPGWLHNTGLEWTYRLAKEPRRLWRRYVFGNPRFVVSAARHRVRDARSRAS